MIKKLMNLIKNYDKIMLLLENNDDVVKSKEKKFYSTFNTPRSQLEYIEKHMKGER